MQAVPLLAQRGSSLVKLDEGAGAQPITYRAQIAQESPHFARSGSLSVGRIPALACSWQPAARLYWAELGREPDSAGLSFWTSQLSNSIATLSQEADALASSPEFATRYGGLDNAGFVNRLYENVLGRAADASGQAAWTNALANGAIRGSVVIGFSESVESKARFESVAGHNGILVV